MLAGNAAGDRSSDLVMLDALYQAEPGLNVGLAAGLCESAAEGQDLRQDGGDTSAVQETSAGYGGNNGIAAKSHANTARAGCQHFVLNGGHRRVATLNERSHSAYEAGMRLC